ncbi:LLM class flavin-dependent oxidoreductase [Actinophytocola sp.]|jgi:5,10-methylenetetrahydromethanopterin reductase|uniref:LLM class flavin-dependent oxidoreductase n=1 Tax=Actinophytocola sp. TaxID=1872138 RepID=UPI002ED9F4C7
MRFGFGVSLVCDDLAAFPGWVRTVDECGFDVIGLTDSPALYPETYVTGVLAAQNTSRVRFGPRVTNPLTRHPIVAASAIGSLDVLSGGRALFGIGAGDSAAHTAGARPARVADIEEYLLTVRGLLSGAEVRYRGAPLRMFSPPRHVPIYVAAAGPKMLRMAGRVADGVIIGTGIIPEVVEHTLGLIRAGAESAGRSLSDLDLWWLCGARLADSRAEAEERMLTLSAALINAHGQVTLGGKLIPDDVLPEARYLVDHYDFDAHIKHGRSPNADLLRSLPRLREHASRRYVVGGTPAECVAQIREAGEAGANQFWWTVSFPDKMSFVRQFSAEVMAPLRSPEPVV